MESFAVVRADDTSKLKTALADLERHGGLTFVDTPKELNPDFADRILLDIMQLREDELRWECKAAAIVPLHDSAGAAIDKLKRIHPPAHIIIISPRYAVFNELLDSVDTLPTLEGYRRTSTSHKDL
ncbi:MAG: DUF356 domain-containing protein [Methanocellales archaeon]|nr:DUF356 domain-containing protein [Methanocellales archaeon]